MSRRNVVLIAVVGVVLAVAVGIWVVVSGSGGAPGPDDPDPTPTASGGTTEPEETQEPGVTAEELSAAVFEATTEPLATVEGEIFRRPDVIPGVVEVTDVYAGRSSTVVRFTLKALDDDAPGVPLEAFNRNRMITDDIRDVAVVDPVAGLRLQPFVGGNSEPDAFCTCSTSPRGVTTNGLQLTATFPPLDQGTTTASVEIPGFPVLEDVPVRRD